mgnify:FL=1
MTYFLYLCKDIFHEIIPLCFWTVQILENLCKISLPDWTSSLSLLLTGRSFLACHLFKLRKCLVFFMSWILTYRLWFGIESGFHVCIFSCLIVSTEFRGYFQRCLGYLFLKDFYWFFKVILLSCFHFTHFPSQPVGDSVLSWVFICSSSYNSPYLV